MIESSVLRGLLRDALRGIPDLVDALKGDIENIQEFTEAGDLYSTAHAMREESLLIAAQGFRFAGQAMSLLEHHFTIFLKSKDPHALVVIMLQGFTQASGFPQGLPLVDLPIHPRYHQMGNYTFERRSIAVDAATNYDFWEFNTSFLSRGAE